VIHSFFGAVARVLDPAAALLQEHSTPADSTVEWRTTRERGTRIGLAAMAMALLAGAGTIGAATLSYAQQDNDFCTSCHVMDSAVPRPPDTPLGEFPHSVSSGSVRNGMYELESADDASPFEPEDATPEQGPSGVGSSARQQVAAAKVPADTFEHSRHTKHACLECHSVGSGHGRLTFEPPRGCAVCHHKAPEQAKCESCHRETKYGAPKPKTMTVTVPNRNPVPRQVDFLHSKHTGKTCVECHSTPVTMALAPARAQCNDCHDDHHSKPEINCSSCHKIADPKAEHYPPSTTHQQCDACHTRPSIERLTPTRNLCVTCHAPKTRDHYNDKQCTTCHFFADPAAYKAKLLTPVQR